MSSARVARDNRRKRHLSIRKRISGTEDKPRLCVFRSLGHIYAQVVNDTVGHVMVSASTLEGEIKLAGQTLTKVEQAKLVGASLGRRAKEKGIGKVVFDRGGYKYHGRVKVLADAARSEGLIF